MLQTQPLIEVWVLFVVVIWGLEFLKAMFLIVQLVLNSLCSESKASVQCLHLPCAENAHVSCHGLALLFGSCFEDGFGM